ncbi:MAG: hypothetical protein GOP50_01525 [Candidatus Heimdallarchaeota archaeon]|nr:hypothetical protein [Candidatus Heimdallarchaeota archaeon]
MTLGTLGAVIKYALKLEAAVISLYEKALETANVKEDNATITSKVSQGQKNIKKLKKLQRENTTEMILEPIKDFHKDSFEEILQTDLETFNFERSGEIENKIALFYEEAASKVSFIQEASYIFQQLALKHSEE